MKLTYGLGMAVAKVAFTLFARWEVEGRESIPPRGPLIVASNHLSNADPAVVMASFNRRLNFLAKEGLFNNPVARRFFTALGVHPVTAKKEDTSALRWALGVLDRDGAVLLFPEGRRSHTGALERGIPGVGYLAFKSQAPIIPVAVHGTEDIPGFWRIAFPFRRIHVRIGEPFSLPAIEGHLSRDTLQQGTDIIMGRIAQLLPPRYRGHYAPAPRRAESSETNSNPRAERDR